MSEKDAVSSQDIPAFVRALGTLALAAATAMVIKWFISTDTKEENTECNDADLHNSLCSTVLDEQTIYDGCLLPDGNQLRNTNPLKVSDGDGKKLKLSLEGCHEFGSNKTPADATSISQDTISKQETGQQINLSCISPKKANQITSVASKLNKVVTLPANSDLFIQREDGCNASVFTATTRVSATNFTEDQMFSGCLTHKCNSLSFERAESIQEPECSFGTRSSNGECIDDLNTECSGCRYKLVGHNNSIAESFVQHGTVSLAENGEKDEALNCYSAINKMKHTTSPVEMKYNIDNMVIDYDDEDNTLNTSIGISERKKVEVICNPFSSKAEIMNTVDACISSCHNGPVISDNTTQFTAVINDNFNCTEVMSHAQKILSPENENAVLAGDVRKDIEQHVVMYSEIDFKGTNIYKSDERQETTFNNAKAVESSSKELKHSNHDVVKYLTDDEKDTENMFFSLENVLSNKESHNSQQCHTPMASYTSRYEVQKHFEELPQFDTINTQKESMTDNSSCYPNNTYELPLSGKSKATTLYNYAEHTALMSTLDLQDPDASFYIQGEQSELQFCAEEISVVLKNQDISKDLSKCLVPEKVHEDINFNKESVELYCTSSKAMTALENIITDSTLSGKVSSTVITEAAPISSVKSIHSGKHDELQDCSDIITRGYMDINHKITDKHNACSKMIKIQGEHCNKDLMSAPPEPCSSPLNTTFPTTFLENAYFCKDTNVSSPAIMGTHNTAHIWQHNANGENVVFQENAIGRDLQLPTMIDTVCSYTKPLENDKQNYTTCYDSNVRLTQNQSMCSTFNNVTSLYSPDRHDVTHSKEKIMSTIAENPELILPEYQSKCRFVKKRPLMTKSCDNILSGRSYQEPTLKNKAQSMLCLLTEYYSSKMPSENGPLEEVARGSFICIPKGLQSVGEAMRFQLTLGNCLELLKLARKKKVQELLKAVYTVISDNYLNVLKNSAVYGQLTGLERDRILQLRMRGKLSICVVETKSIFRLNKYTRCPVETTEGKAQLYSLDVEINQWKPVTCIPAEACLKGCSICSMHNYLFIAGGLQETAEGLQCSNKLFCYNPLTDIWTQLSPMQEGRSQLKLIPLDAYLYAIGGECLNTVEKYDPRSNKWTFVAPLPKGTFAVAHEAAACGGEIYVSGGHLFYRLLKYSPVHDQWEECPFNGSKGRSCDMVAVGSILYRFDMHKDSSVNILRYNTIGKMWSEYTAVFPGSKIPFRCTLLDGNIYCINRETTAKFSLEDEKAVFEAGVFRKMPTRGTGSPHPTVLCLRGTVSQTSV